MHSLSYGNEFGLSDNEREKQTMKNSYSCKRKSIHFATEVKATRLWLIKDCVTIQEQNVS